MKMVNLRSKTVVATASVAAAGGLVFGAAEAFAATPAAASTSGSPAAATASASAGGKGRHACPMSTETPKSLKPSQGAKPRHARACVGGRGGFGGAGGPGFGRGQLTKGGVHGQETVKDKTGAYVVEEWQVGKVGSISGSSITVTDASGTTWTWTAQSGIKYSVEGKSGALSGVHVGDTVLLRGTQSGGANDATALMDQGQGKTG